MANGVIIPNDIPMKLLSSENMTSSVTTHSISGSFSHYKAIIVVIYDNGNSVRATAYVPLELFNSTNSQVLSEFVVSDARFTSVVGYVSDTSYKVRYVGNSTPLVTPICKIYGIG